ncbi:MAG TPA: DNRLRE domain-containing protein [Myxococcaceae bacterium]|nr:DNRLRE domain-containing protein [Myxococcaceae bacterium]
MKRFVASLACLLSTAAGAAEVTLRDGVSPEAAYAGTRDVVLQSPLYAPDVNYNDMANTVDMSPVRRGVLLQWTLDGIPASATVEAVSVTVSLPNGGTNRFPFWECLRPWSESQATWQQARNGDPWSAGGANGVGVDRGSTPLGFLTGGPSDAVTLPLNAEGVQVVQKWVSNPGTNHGFLIANYDPSVGPDGYRFFSSEASSPGQRPRLNVTYGGTTVSFQNGLAPTTAYSGTQDMMMADGPPRNANANGWPLMAGPDPEASILLSFDVSPIPANSRVTEATLELFVTDPTPSPLTVSGMLRPWGETTATWLTADGASPWEEAGTGATDRGVTVFGSVPSVPLGPLAIPLTNDGISEVNAWVRGERANFGFTLRNPEDAVVFASREDAVSERRPALRLTYTVEGSPESPSPSPDGGTNDGKPDPGGDPLAARYRVGLGCATSGQYGLAPWAALVAFILSRRRRPALHP